MLSGSACSAASPRSAEPAAMELRYSAYWQSLLDHEPVTLSGDTTVQVDVPQANLLTVETLHKLMVPRERGCDDHGHGIRRGGVG